MEFGLSEEQVMLQDSMSGFLAGASSLDVVREVASGEADASAISKGLSEMGSAQLLVPEAHGGLGMGFLDAALVQETLGAAVSPARYMATVMATAGLMAAGSDAQQSDWLPKIASGDALFAVAVQEHVGAREGAGIAAKGGKLSGKSLFAIEAEGATHVMVAGTDGNLHIAAMGDVTATEMRAIDRTRRFHELTFDGAPSEALTGKDGADRVVQVGRLLAAADTLGAADVMLKKAVEYAKERKQFGRVIGSFQAVKHMCAEMAAHLEPARALVWHAAHALDTGDDEAALMACLAKSHLSEIGTIIAKTSTEVYGGMGFTDLVGLHYWYKRIGVNRQLFGSPEKVREDAAKLQGWA